MLRIGRTVPVGLAVLALLAGACAEPTDDVSLEGPSTTSTTEKESTATTEPKESTTTTERVTTTTAPPQPVEVGRWTGSADTDTPNFTVKQSWELHWVISGGAGASVSWVVPGDEYGQDSLSLDPGSGSSLIRKGGTFYLEISTFGAAYEIWAVDVPN